MTNPIRNLPLSERIRTDTTNIVCYAVSASVWARLAGLYTVFPAHGKPGYRMFLVSSGLTTILDTMLQAPKLSTNGVIHL